jgi:hypothetical protein
MAAPGGLHLLGLGGPFAEPGLVIALAPAQAQADAPQGALFSAISSPCDQR